MSNKVRYTVDEFRFIVIGIVEWAKVVRQRYLNTECEVCGIQYHPRMGPPPKERRSTKYEACGHAHFREMWNEWDDDTNDWRSQ